MSENRLKDLHDAGVAIWLDFIDRTILKNGELARRIRDDAVTGMTSNPTIFEKALAEGSAYDDQIRFSAGDFTAMELFERIATTDVRDACDIFRPTHDAMHGADGFVSIEVSPGAANDATATIDEATRLWKTVDRPNAFVKVPGTVEGAKAVRQLTADRHQHQHHAAVRDRSVRARHRRVHGRARGARRRGKRHHEDPFGGELLREPRGHRDRQASRRRGQGETPPTRRRSRR